MNKFIDFFFQEVRSSTFFTNLRRIFETLILTFEFESNESLDEIKDLLRLYGMETRELIHRYYLDVHKQSITESNDSLGNLSVKCSLDGRNLKVNHRNFSLFSLFKYIFF